MRRSHIIAAIGVAGFGLSSCAVTKVVTAPVKLAGKAAVGTTKIAGKAAVGTTKVVGKTAVGTTKVVGKTAVGTTKLAAKGVLATGKGIYYVGSVPVKITDAALDTTAKLLTITVQVVDLTGALVSATRVVNAARLEAELAGLKTAKNVVSVLVDIAK